jgi:hypothetical protein
MAPPRTDTPGSAWALELGTRARWPRRQSLLPPGAEVCIPSGVPDVYDARLALGRLWQLYRRFVQARSLEQGYRWRSAPMPSEVRILAADCGLKLGPQMGRVVVVCLRCRREVYLLRACLDGWACARCDPQRLSQVERLMGSYAMGLRIGYTGRAMRRRRIRLAANLARLARHARCPSDVCHLALGSALEEYSPHWLRGRRPGHGGVAGDLGSPVLRDLGSVFMRAIIDQLLHPDAFYARFVQC